MGQAAPDHSGNSSRIDRVLIVEDEILIRMYLAEELRSAGFDVVEASNAEEAQRALLHANVELLLTDIRMPGPMDGIALARWVRQQFPAMKIAVLSANVDTLPPDGADAAFSKPLDMFDILKGLRRLLPKAERGGA